MPESDNEDLREVLLHNYRIVYRLKGDEITVLAVLHGAMDITGVAERRPWDLS